MVTAWLFLLFFFTYTQSRVCHWGLRRSSLSPHVLAETAKLDRFAYAHAQTCMHAHTHNSNSCLFLRGNALFVPGHLVKTADLLLRPAMAINQHTHTHAHWHTALLNIHADTKSSRHHQPFLYRRTDTISVCFIAAQLTIFSSAYNLTVMFPLLSLAWSAQRSWWLFVFSLLTFLFPL